MDPLISERNRRACEVVADEFAAYILSWDAIRKRGYLSDGKRTFIFMEDRVLDSSIIHALDEGDVHRLVCSTCLPAGDVSGHRDRVASILRYANSAEVFRFLGLQREDARMRACRLFIDGRFDKAAAEYEKLLKNDQRDVETVKSLADAYIRSNRRSAAIDLLNREIESFDGGEAFELDMFLMGCLTDAGRYKEAISAVDRLLSRNELDWRMASWLRKRRVRFESAVNNEVRVQSIHSADVIPLDISLGFDRIVQDFCDLGETKVEQAMKFVRNLTNCGFAATRMHTQTLSILKKAKLYFQSFEYRSKCDCYRDILKMVESFDRDFMSRESSDRIVGQKFLLMLQCLCSQVRGHLVRLTEKEVPIAINSQSEKCNIDNGLLVWSMRVSAGDKSYPSVRSFSISLVGRQDFEPVTYEYSQEECPEDGVCVQLAFSPTEDELKDRCGSVDIKIDYVKQIDPCLIDDNDLHVAFGASRKKMQFLVDGGEQFGELDNPYERLTRPTDSFFVGRQEVMAELLRMFDLGCSGVGFILYGQHYCGKSTVMDNFFAPLEKDSRFVVTRLNGQNWSAAPQLEFMRAVAIKNGLEEIDDVAKLRLEIEAFGKKLQKDGKTWVVGIDEFTKQYTNYCRQRRGRPDDYAYGLRETLNQYLGEVRTFLDNGTFNLLLIGQEDTAQFFDDPDFSNAVSRIKRRRLSFLSPDAIREYATVPVRNQSVREDFYRGKSLDLIVRWTGGSPWLAQKVMTKIFNTLIKIKYPVVQELIVQMAVDGLMDDSGNDSLSKMDFEPFLSLRSYEFPDDAVEDFYRRFVKASKEGVWTPISCFSDDPEDVKKISILCEREIFERKNGNVRMKARLFDRWLRNNIETFGG